MDPLSLSLLEEVGFHDDPVHTPGMLSKALELLERFGSKTHLHNRRKHKSAKYHLRSFDLVAVLAVLGSPCEAPRKGPHFSPVP